MERYFGQFASAEDVEQQWAGEGALNGAVVIAATYTNEDYSGDATIVFRKEGKLYEAHCSHCSCNGLEYWEPEETSLEALMDRYTAAKNYNEDRYGNDFVSAVKRGLLDEIFEEEVLVK